MHLSSTVAPRNTRTLKLCFLFSLCRFSLIPYNIEPPIINVVPFLHFFGFVSIFLDLMILLFSVYSYFCTLLKFKQGGGLSQFYLANILIFSGRLD